MKQNSTPCTGGLKSCLQNAWTTWQDKDKRQQYIKNSFPPRTIFTLALFWYIFPYNCYLYRVYLTPHFIHNSMGLLMLSALPFIVQALFLFVCWRKHPKTATSTPAARTLFRLKAFTALCCLFAVTQFPMWLVILIVAPIFWLMYISREEILSSLQQILSS